MRTASGEGHPSTAVHGFSIDPTDFWLKAIHPPIPLGQNTSRCFTSQILRNATVEKWPHRPKSTMNHRMKLTCEPFEPKEAVQNEPTIMFPFREEVLKARTNPSEGQEGQRKGVGMGRRQPSIHAAYGFPIDRRDLEVFSHIGFPTLFVQIPGFPPNCQNWIFLSKVPIRRVKLPYPN